MSIKTTIQVQDPSGNLIDLTRDVKFTAGVNAKLSALNILASRNFKGMFNGSEGLIPSQGLKMVKRTPTKRTLKGVSSGLASFSEFVKATNLVFHRFDIYREDYTENFLLDSWDQNFVDKGISVVANLTQNYLISVAEQDLNKLITDAIAAADALSIYTSQTATGMPSGVQPAAATTTAGSITAMKNGRRITGVITDIDADADNRMKLIRTAISQFVSIGSPKSIESNYPFAINGFNMSDIVVVAAYDAITKIKDSFTTTVVNLNNPGSVRNLNGYVGTIDGGVEVIETNQLPMGVEYLIMTKRVFVRQRANDRSYVGSIQLADTVVDGAGSVIELAPNTYKYKTLIPTLKGIAFPEEIIAIKA